MFKCLSLKTAGHKSHPITRENSESQMCLPELLMEVVTVEGDTVGLSVISSRSRLPSSVSCQSHVTGCDVTFSCHVMEGGGGGGRRAADQRRGGGRRAQQAGLSRPDRNCTSQRETRRKNDFDLPLNEEDRPGKKTRTPSF